MGEELRTSSMWLSAYSGITGLCVRSAKKDLKVNGLHNKLPKYIEIITNEVATSVIQLEDTLNLPESK